MTTIDSGPTTAPRGAAVHVTSAPVTESSLRDSAATVANVPAAMSVGSLQTRSRRGRSAPAALVAPTRNVNVTATCARVLHPDMAFPPVWGVGPPTFSLLPGTLAARGRSTSNG